MAPLKDNVKEVKERGKRVLKTFTPNSGGNTPTPPRPRREFMNNAMGMLFIFLVLMTVYSFIAENRTKTTAIPISEVAADVARGDVAEIRAAGEELTVVYTKGGITKSSQKEPGVGLSETLVNYGVPVEKLREVKISVEKEGGFTFWFLNLAPFIIPILFIAVFIWFLARQVKGAGMQAFNF